ncbi:hypothetical protein [Huintestinicola sp.]
MKIENNSSAMTAISVQNTQKAESAKLPQPEKEEPPKYDEYIPSEKEEPIGLYKMEYDENGNKRIAFDSPDERSETEECTCNTDKVDGELERLREKARDFEQKLRYARDENEAEEIQKQLEAVKNELAQKDNDAYRKNNAVFS